MSNSYTLAFSKSQSTSHPASTDSSWVAFPTPKLNGITISKNKVWSANTGRKSNAEMAGTIKAIKSKIEIEFPPLSTSQSNTIDGFVSDATNQWQWCKCTFPNGTISYFRGYWGDAAYPIYGFINGNLSIIGVKADFIEK